MPSYDTTKIWQSNLSIKTGEDRDEIYRKKLRDSYESLRDKSTILAGEIAISLPNFTVHDITHLDALWEMAQIVVGDEYILNPSEVFVLGGAILIHDIGMGIAAYPNGIEEIRASSEWQRFKKIEEFKSGLDVDSKPESKKLIDLIYFREMHAKRAEQLLFTSWRDVSGFDHSLINDPDIRHTYGEVIGKIAYSHWLEVKSLEDYLGPTLGAPGGFPNNWTVDPVKIACILRCADIIHIDSQRAPSFLSALRNLSGDSKQHWKFQNKLYQPRLEDDRLVFTTKSSFDTDEINSWWMCFDALKGVDKELYTVDQLLSDTKRQRFSAKSVAGVDDVRRMARLIQVKDWTPVDSKIHISQVSRIIKNLGGSSLYGRDSVIFIRELIQNASDAIKARRFIEDLDDSFGKITIKFYKENEKEYVSIVDNGIGMSERVITDVLLDFGRSLWNDQIVFEEFPDTIVKFDNTGKYGIGFFSIFMYSKNITLRTRRFEGARSDTTVVEFSDGIDSRPILRKAKSEEYLRDGGTEIIIELLDITFDDLLERASKDASRYSDKNIKADFKDLIKTIVPAPEVDIDIFYDGKSENLMRANDWLKLEVEDFIKRIVPYDDRIGESISYYRERLRVVEFEGRPIARICFIDPRKVYYGSDGKIVVGGLNAGSMFKIFGIMQGKPLRASRDAAIPLISDQALTEFLQEEERYALTLDDADQHVMSEGFYSLGYLSKSIKSFIYNQGLVSLDEAKEIIRDLDEVRIASEYILDEYSSKSMDLVPTMTGLFFAESTSVSIFSYANGGSRWSISKELPNLVPQQILLNAVAEVWNIDLEEMNKFIEDFTFGDRVSVGKVGDIEIFSRHVITISRQDFTSS